MFDAPWKMFSTSYILLSAILFWLFGQTFTNCKTPEKNLKSKKTTSLSEECQPPVGLSLSAEHKPSTVDRLLLFPQNFNTTKRCLDDDIFSELLALIIDDVISCFKMHAFFSSVAIVTQIFLWQVWISTTSTVVCSEESKKKVSCLFSFIFFFFFSFVI